VLRIAARHPRIIRSLNSPAMRAMRPPVAEMIPPFRPYLGSTWTGLDLTMLATLCEWRFKPATLGGRPVKVYYTLTTTFEVFH